MRRLILKSFQSPGDVVMLTAAVRDLHAACPGQFETDVRTSADELWANNPRITPLKENEPGVEVIDMHYPLVHQSDQRPYHFIHGFTQYLEEKLSVRVPVTRFHGDIHLSRDEKAAPPPARELGVPDHFWIVVAGGKYDFTAKWWNPASYQKVVDHFKGRIAFVQCGEAGHWHPPLEGVVNLVGKTTTREFVRLMHHAVGVLCPVSFGMHLAAAVEVRGGNAKYRPCVIVAGGREPAHWEQYPGHQFISNVGALPCCAHGGCWRSRCQLVEDGDEKDCRNVCEAPVEVSRDLRIPKCMAMITPEDVIRRIDSYYEGGVLNGNGRPAAVASPCCPDAKADSRKISVTFYHGLGDCAYFAHLIPLYTRRGYEVEVECSPDKHLLFKIAGANPITRGAAAQHPWGYPTGGTYEGHGRYWQGSKMASNVSRRPLPEIGNLEKLWQEYCDVQFDVEPHLPEEAKRTADTWVSRLPRPITLLHTKGNTAQERKSLPDETAAQFYREFLDHCDGTLVLLDWDNRVPRLASHRVRHLSDFGACPTATLLALMNRADLIVGVDSGPLHAARFTKTLTIGLWRPGHYPSTYSLPRRQQLNVVLAEHTQQWNRWKRIPWNIVEHPGGEFRADVIAEFCRQMLDAPRYLSREDIAADVQLRQFVRQWCRGVNGNALSTYCDRHRSFDVVLREATRRFERPTVVETGIIRAEEDWAGAGFFTYWAGAYAARQSGRLFAVDIDPRNCEFARSWTGGFGDTVQVRQQDSVAFLSQFAESIDVLYLDSLDTTEPGHAEHALREVEAGLPRLREKSLIVFDDTPWRGQAWTGKGAIAVPHLLKRGWKLLYAGYQVVLARD